MDEQNTKKDTPQENESSRRSSDPTDGVEQAKEEDRACHRDGGQSEHYAWGLSWPQFIAATVSFLSVIVATITVSLRWYTDTLLQARSQEKERARVVLSAMQQTSTTPLSFSLIFKNVGETTALNTYGAWLGGECQYTSQQECLAWCLHPLPETKGKAYGPLLSQDRHTEEFFYTFKTGKARKKQRPIYYCGYFAYSDVFCMWRRQFYALSYNPATEQFSHYTVSNEEAREQNCSP